MLSLMLFFGCTNDPEKSSEQETPTQKLFNLDRIPQVELQFSLSQLNTLLTIFDLNPKNEKKVNGNANYLSNRIQLIPLVI